MSSTVAIAPFTFDRHREGECCAYCDSTEHIALFCDAMLEDARQFSLFGGSSVEPAPSTSRRHEFGGCVPVPFQPVSYLRGTVAWRSLLNRQSKPKQPGSTEPLADRFARGMWRE